MKEDEDLISIEKDFEESENMPTTNIKDYKFTTMGGDIQIRQLVQQLNEDDIEIPNIQRKYVWSNIIASKFIESALLDLPLPSIFLCKQKNGKFLIIDGLQRLTSLKMFLNMDNHNGKLFKLSNSKDIYIDWRGKAFNELSLDDQRKLKNKTIHAIIVEQLHPENYDGLYLIFERINSGGIQLNQQEIRNAVFQTKYTDMLNELNRTPLWRQFFGDKSLHKRMKDVEMILRFFALSQNPLKSKELGSISFVEMMNGQMSRTVNYTDAQLEKEKASFLKTIDVVRDNFGTNIFRINPSSPKKTTKKFFATTFDSIMVATFYAISKNLNSTSSVDKLKLLFSNETFKEFTNSHTTDNKAIYGRISTACEILYGIKYAD